MTVLGEMNKGSYELNGGNRTFRESSGLWYPPPSQPWLRSHLVGE